MFGIWGKTERLIKKLLHTQIIAIVTEIKKYLIYKSNYFGLKIVCINSGYPWFLFLYAIFSIKILVKNVDGYQ